MVVLGLLAFVLGFLLASAAFGFGLPGGGLVGGPALPLLLLGLQPVILNGKFSPMMATLTLDESGRLLLPAPILRVLGKQPGVEMKVEVTPGRIELLNDQEDDVPLITELSPEGTLLFPAGVKPPSAERIVAAIKSDRDDRIGKLSRR